MQGRFTSKLETYIGIALLLLAVLGFLFSVLTSLPNKSEVAATANPLKEIPRDMFSSDNEIIQSIKKLNTPGGVPVTVNPDTLGKTSAFGNF